MTEQITAASLRATLKAMVIGESVTLDITTGNRKTLEAFLSKAAQFSHRRYEWEFTNATLRILRTWNVAHDKWGISKFKAGVPYVFRVPASEHPSIRSAARLLRQTSGMIVVCRAKPDGMFVMVSGYDPLPNPSQRQAAPAPITRTEFELMANEKDGANGREYRFPIDGLKVGESLFVTLKDEPRAVNLRVFCHYHGGRLLRKFSVKAEEGGHRITRKL